MLRPDATVRLFTRERDRDAFTYHGIVTAIPEDVSGSRPVQVIWQLRGHAQDFAADPGEVKPSQRILTEGAARSITVNAYERNRAARERCIAHWGRRCYCCELDMGERYGEIAEGYIHVHHLKGLASIGAEYTVDPVTDLRPVCPNCHAVLHLTEPPTSVDELRQRL